MDRQKVIETLKYLISGECTDTQMDYVEEIDEAIALLKEQGEIRHGEWKWSHGGECSECGFHNSNFSYKYCPMCGTIMDT
jgi:hypothetical protein